MWKIINPILITIGIAMILLVTCNKIKHANHDCSKHEKIILNEKKESKDNVLAYAIQYWKIMIIDCMN